MKISELRVENFKKVISIEIKPNTALVVIGGQNGHGKSSVLDSIACALGGEKLAPPEPIRHGERTAIVRVTLDNGWKAERRWQRTKGGGTTSKLTVTGADGETIASPQTILGSLIGRLSFDPEEYSRFEPKKQLDVLRELSGVDLTDVVKQRAEAFALRTDINRDIQSVNGALLQLGHVPEPGTPVNVQNLLKEQAATLDLVERRRMAREDVGRVEGQYQGALERQQKLELELERVKGLVADSARQLFAARQIYQELPEPTDPRDINAKIIEAQKINADVADAMRRREEMSRQHSLLKDLETRAAQHTRTIADCDDERESRIASAKFPIPGLGFGLDGVTYNGVPFEQASSSERIRVSVAIGLALNPTLRVIQIRNGSLLDDDSMAVVAEMAEKHEAQVWVERVSKGGEVGFIMENGMIAEADEDLWGRE